MLHQNPWILILTMDLEIIDFEWITTEILKIADLCGGGKVVSVLEGGYGSYNTKKKATRFHRASTRSTGAPTVSISLLSLC